MEQAAAVTVLGAGSWGTALAIQFARSGRATRLWGRDRAQLLAMAQSRRNTRNLPEDELPTSLSVEPDLQAALTNTQNKHNTKPNQTNRAKDEKNAPILAPD